MEKEVLMIEDGSITQKEFQERIKKCLVEMEKNQIDLMYVYGDSARPDNLIYLTNYRPIGTDLPGNTGYNAVFLLTRDGTPTLIIDREWYVDWAREESWVEDILADDQGDTLSLSFDYMKKKKLISGRIEVDTDLMPGNVYKRFTRIFRDCRLDEESRIVGKLREIKNENEIKMIVKGLEILGRAQDAGFAIAKEGRSEADVALEIRRVIMEEGADYPRALFVDSGRRSTIALASPMSTTRKLQKGDMVSVSTFCTYKNYSPGLDRNWVIGEPSEKQRKLADIELKALEQAIGHVKPGVKASDFMKPIYTDFVEPLLQEAGFKDYNLQGYIGHGTGIMTKETPFLWKMDSTALKPGMVIHMEPGIYSKDPRIGGIRTADTIVVTETGSENLTKYPRRIGTLA
jgi:Xaa-Pro aminopeptidase